MESRLSSVLLAARCCPAAAGSIAATSPAPGRRRGARRAEPTIIEPQVNRREVKTPKIKAKDFELGAYFGALSIQDFGTNPVYGVRAAYHVTEDFFLEGFLARSKAGTEQPRGQTFPDITVLSNSGRHFTYYDLDVGYNVLPGEMFLGRGRAFNSALYVTSAWAM
jgi:hypothetical protein